MILTVQHVMEKHFSKIRLLFLVILLLLWPAAGKPTASTDVDFAYKISVETSLERRLRSVLTEIAGTDKLIVIVNAEVETKALRKETKPARLKKGDVLPGVPLRKTFGLTLHERKPAEISLPEEIRNMVRQLSVTVLVDRHVPEPITKVLREVAINIIGYNPDQGDRLSIKRISFEEMPFSWKSLLYPPNLYWLILIVLGGFFLLTAAAFLINHPFKKLSSTLQNVNWDSIRGNTSGNTETHNIYTGIGNTGEPTYEDMESPPPFSFVKSRHVNDVAFLLKNESTLDIAIVANYLEPDLATKLLEHFPNEKQVEIALSLSGTEEIDPEKVHHLEESIKSRLRYMVGGEDKVASILGLTDEEVRNRFFDTIQNMDTDTAVRLKEKVKSFETIILEMPPRSIQVLYRQMDPINFARVLKSSPDEVQKKAVESLSEGAAERLQQEIDLCRPFPPQHLRREKQNIILTVRRMAAAGLLQEV